MKQFTAERTSETRDEIWLVQHPPFTRKAWRASRNTCCTAPTSLL